MVLVYVILPLVFPKSRLLFNTRPCNFLSTPLMFTLHSPPFGFYHLLSLVPFIFRLFSFVCSYRVRGMQQWQGPSYAIARSWDRAWLPRSIDSAMTDYWLTEVSMVGSKAGKELALPQLSEVYFTYCSTELSSTLTWAWDQI